MPKLLDFRCAVITGGGGGIGKATARHLVSKGKTVLLAGRTESNLQSAARDVGAAGYYLVDAGKTADMSPFVGRITRAHPELDCLINNAGVQRAPGYPPGRRLYCQGRPGNRHQTSGAAMHLTLGAAAAPADQARRRDYQTCRAFWALCPFPSSTPVYKWHQGVAALLEHEPAHAATAGWVGRARSRDCAAHGGDGPAPREGGPRR